MINQVVCNSGTEILVLFIALLVFAICALVVYLNVRKFQHSIDEWGTQAGDFVEQFIVGPDGELQTAKDASSEQGRKPKRKPDQRPKVSGCLFQQFIIALVGLVTAIISALAVSNPVIALNVEAICNTIFDQDITPIITSQATAIPVTLEPSTTYTPTMELSLTYTLIPTEVVTSTPAPSVTSTSTLEPPTITVIPTSITPTSIFHPLTLTESLNIWSSYLGLSSGEVTFEGIPFEIGKEQNTYGCRREINATVATTTVQIENPYVVYLLGNSGNGFNSSLGRDIGHIDLIFGEERYTYNLILGQTIRDWATPEGNVVTTVTSANTTEIWRGTSYDGRIGRLDLIRIEIPQEYLGQTLTSIQVIDTTGGALSSGVDPCIQIQAITVESRQ